MAQAVIEIAKAVAAAFVLAFVIGVLLGVFKKIFYVASDEKAEAIRKALPGANCGACGYPGCDGFAVAVAKGEAPTSGCLVGRAKVADEVAKIMGAGA